MRRARQSPGICRSQASAQLVYKSSSHWSSRRICRSRADAFVRCDAVTPTVLHFHGNGHDSGGSPPTPCTGDGRADILNCDGPFLTQALRSIRPIRPRAGLCPTRRLTAQPIETFTIQTGFGIRTNAARRRDDRRLVGVLWCVWRWRRQCRLDHQGLGGWRPWIRGESKGHAGSSERSQVAFGQSIPARNYCAQNIVLTIDPGFHRLAKQHQNLLRLAIRLSRNTARHARPLRLQGDDAGARAG